MKFLIFRDGRSVSNPKTKSGFANSSDSLIHEAKNAEAAVRGADPPAGHVLEVYHLSLEPEIYEVRQQPRPAKTFHQI